ncbi:hypothetical protein C0J52_23891 [Blattella germanica]|nr:hypothetical protein C0J52_23891 [Blattella germanica]
MQNMQTSPLPSYSILISMRGSGVWLGRLRPQDMLIMVFIASLPGQQIATQLVNSNPAHNNS